MSVDERRRHGRIETGLTCSIATAEDIGEGKVINLSLGGAGLVSRRGLTAVSASVTLDIEVPDSTTPLVITGVVVRVQERGDEALYGIRFLPGPPAVQEELARVLKGLAASRGVGQRAHPRVHRRIQVTCRSRAEFEATMSDVSRGGLALQCGTAHQVGDEVVAALGTSQLPNALELVGVVTRAEPVGGGQFRIGLQFAPLLPEQQRQLATLLDLLLGLEGPKT